ncbi:MAG: hypothetical protein L0Y35_04925, partial [Flammeovirgaceae bacterium]|nr:hypothetical protein [Flammeovirgaceae bacterium]
MKKFVVALILLPNLLLGQQEKEIGNLLTEGVPDIPQALAERMNQYQNTRAASFSGWLPDGKGILIATRFGDTPQLHLVEMPGGARKQITFFKEPIGGGSFSPDPKYKGFMFTKDVGGNEFRQLYWFDLITGKYDLLSDGGRTQNTMPSWSNKGDQFIYVSTRRNLKDFDLYTSSMANPKEAKIILQQGGSWSPVDWSPDDKKVIVQNNISANHSYLHVLDLATAKLEQVNPSSEEIAYSGGVWSGDSKGIFLVNDEGTEFQTLKYYDVATRKFTDITKSIPWDVDNYTISRNRGTIIFVTNENGIDKMYQLNTLTKKYTAVSGIPEGLIGGMDFHPTKNELAFTISTPQSPGDVYSIDLGTNKLTRWTYSEIGGLDPSTFPKAELIEYETFDQVIGKPRKIPAFIYRPKNATGKIPVVINIHGGPEGQSRPSFSSFTTFLVNE